jgi:hypothetical protein
MIANQVIMHASPERAVFNVRVYVKVIVRTILLFS